MLRRAMQIPIHVVSVSARAVQRGGRQVAAGAGVAGLAVVAGAMEEAGNQAALARSGRPTGVASTNPWQ
ncbi:hypothetical protein RF679_01140 [Undibacterium cyanobacteriorum]|uniref:Uncharacterized protein n=1 Tax=Undibacterium cyanobacteriorum TaxID=3073561 RepID=A0ABY9RI57_9BURK|nr:hypothetical protein [Undibacterium sp. 20NA77.5]WMW80901.1 hypothetical protein RF679_01140 [Undibacterium sp. 20NA77.5]